MKKLSIILTLLFAVAGYAQIEHYEADYIQLFKKDVQAEARSIIEANLELTEEQAKEFWPLYDEYDAAMDLLFDERINLRAEFLLDYLALSDETAADLIGKFNAFDQKKLDTQNNFTQKFLAVLPAKVVGKFLQLYHRIDLMIELQKTSTMPLIMIESEE